MTNVIKYLCNKVIIRMCKHCESLSKDGFAVLEGALSKECLGQLRRAYYASWAEIRANWSDLSWKTRQYSPDCSPKTRFVGVGEYSVHVVMSSGRCT